MKKIALILLGGALSSFFVWQNSIDLKDKHQPQLANIFDSQKTGEVQTNARPFSSPKVEPLASTVTFSSIPTRTPVSIPTLTKTPTPTPIPTTKITFTPTPTPSPTSPQRLLTISKSGRVVINEIGWSGTQAAATDEWIELYNTEKYPIDISGWILKTDDNSPNIIFKDSTIMAANSYFIIERTDDNTISDLNADLVSSFGQGGLRDSGEVLILSDANGQMVDRAGAAGLGWYAGDSSQKSSMEKIDSLQSGESASNWKTFYGTSSYHDANSNPIRGTPKSKNSTLYSPVITTSSGGGGGGNQTVATTPSPTPTTTPEPEESELAIRKVVINEIAWMGTASSSNDEWIELYNTSSQSVNLTGWTLKAQDGTPDISLASKSINPFGFYLLERTDNTTISNIVADQIYTGALGNGGEILELRDASGDPQDIVSKSDSGGWYAGDNTTKSTMERINPLASGSSQTNWGNNNSVIKNGLDAGGNTVNGTPKARNSLYISQKPSAVTNLTLSGSTNLNNVFFTWTTPSDADTISASLSYDFRYATKSFDTASDWNNAKIAIGLPALQGDPVVDNFSMTIDDFNKTYYFALKTKDSDNNFSDISNQVSYLIPSAISVSSGWPMSGLNQLHSLKMSFSGPYFATATKSWEFSWPSGTALGQPIIAPSGKILLGATLGAMTQLYAIAPSGSESWHYDGTSGASIGTSVALADNSVVFNYSSGGTELTRLGANGTLKYANNIGGIVSITIGKDGITYLTRSPSVNNFMAVGLDGTIKWQVTQDSIGGLMPVILDNDKIYQTARISGVPYFYALDAKDGASLWPEPKRMDHDCLCGVSNPSYDAASDTLYAAAEKYIWQIKPDGTGSEAFFADRANGQGLTSTTISIDNDNIIVGIDYSLANPASQSVVLAINKTTKNIAWSYPVDAKINSQISIDDQSNVYFATQNGKVYSLNSTGGLNWKIELGANTAAYPVIDTNGLYMSLNNGKLIKIEE